jgi:serine/threonine protein kinase
MKPKQNMLTPEAIFKYSKDYKLTVEMLDKDTATLTLRAIYKNENKDELLNFCAKNGIPIQEPKQNQIEELYPQLKTYKINNEEFYGNFEEHKNIGNGAFSSVYKAMSKLDRRIYAIKVIRVYAKLTDTLSESREISIDEKELNEFRLLASLDYHQNIVRRYYNWITNGWILPNDQMVGEMDESVSISESVAVPSNSEKLTICIVMDYYDNTLHDYMSKRKQINKAESFNIFEGIIKGIEYLHQNQIMHRDIKPQNVFLKAKQAVIGDFGLSRKIMGDSVYNSCKSRSSSTSSSDEFTNGIGSYRYISPEQLSTKEYNEKTDLFPCGLILIELFYIFTTVFEQSNTFDKIRKGEGLSEDIKSEIGEELSAMVSLLTKLDYHDRASASDLLKSDVFKMAKAKFSV